MSWDDDSAAARRAAAHGPLRAAKIASGGPAISPANHTTDMDCVAQYLVDVPMDPDRPTTLRFSYGDGAVEDFAVDQGTGVQQLMVRHQFREGAWSHAQVASILETGAWDGAATFHDAGHLHRLPLWNHVGRLSVTGDDYTEAVIVVGHQEHGDPARAATQTVSETIAFAHANGWFRLRTNARDDNGWKLAADTYDVNFVPVGYDGHYVWSYPGGSCQSGLPGLVKLGTVDIDDTGMIIGGGGTYFRDYADNEARFDLPPEAMANDDEEEAAVGISDPEGQNGNQAPLYVQPASEA